MEEFLNRLHPAVVHFPIALLLAAALFEIGGLVKPGWRLRCAASWALGLGALGALAAAAVFHPEPQVEGLPFAGLFEWHEVLAWCTVALALPLAALRFWLLRKGPEPLERGIGRWGFAVGLVIIAALVAGAGYCGGQLVFEHGLGVTAPMTMPAPTPTVAPVATPATVRPTGGASGEAVPKDQATLRSLLKADPERFFEVPDNLKTLIELSQDRAQAQETSTALLCAMVNGYGPQVLYAPDGNFEDLKGLLKRSGIDESCILPIYHVQIIEPYESTAYVYKTALQILLRRGGTESERKFMIEMLDTARVDQRLLEILVLALGKERDPYLRNHLWFIVRRNRDRSLLPKLEKMAGSGSNAIARQGSIMGLAAIRGEEVCPFLKGLLTDADPDVRVSAALALAELKNPAGLEVLVGLLDPQKPSDWKGVPDVLESLTGQKFDDDYTKWREWLDRPAPSAAPQ